jgi:hypothetical protein
MSVLAIEVEVNGKRLALAGAKDLALLSAGIAAGVGQEKRTIQADSDAFHLTVMGLTSGLTARIADLTWIKGLPLRVGDAITLRIVRAKQPDPPTQVLRTPSSEELASAAEKERSGLTARSRATRQKRRALKRGR